MTLDTFTGFTGLLNERWKRDLSDLIYYYKQDRFHVIRLNSIVYYLGDMAWIPPIRIPQDYTQLSVQEMADLLERILQEGNYTTLVLDVGSYGRDALPLTGKMPGDLHADPGGPVFCRKCGSLRNTWRQWETARSWKRSRRSMCRW